MWVMAREQLQKKPWRAAIRVFHLALVSRWAVFVAWIILVKLQGCSEMQRVMARAESRRCARKEIT